MTTGPMKSGRRSLTVTTVPAQVGGWYWVNERTVHYRPQVYWQAGTKVTVDAKIYGVDLAADTTAKPTAP